MKKKKADRKAAAEKKKKRSRLNPKEPGILKPVNKENDEDETSEEIEPGAADIIEKEESEGDEDVPEKEHAAGAVKGGYKNSLLLYFDQIRAEKVLTEKEEKDIIKRAQNGEKKAREGLIRANLKLVVKIAKRYEYFGVPLVDLIEEGNIGLMKALDKFKLQLGFRFSTYATWWIKQSINRAIANQKNTIRIPVHILDIYHKYLKFIEKELKNKGTYPEKDDIARKLKIDPLKLNEILNIIKAPKSLDLEYENEESDTGRTLKDTIEDTSSEKSDEVFFEKDKKEKMMKLVQKLKPKEQQVIIHRFGLDNDTILTLEEIGEKLKLTRERIRQIELIAIKKLKYLMKSTDNN
jgi:RNA polymerase primary sigma factor